MLTERLAGVAEQHAREGDQVKVRTAEALTSLDGEQLVWRLEELHGALFTSIPDLPLPSQIDHLLVLIHRNLSATAYVNELRQRAEFCLNRPIQAGELIYASDVKHLRSYDIGVEIPPDAAVVVFRSFGWRRALFYDFNPLVDDTYTREYDMRAVLEQQTLALMTGKFGVQPPAAIVQQAITELEALLAECCEEEAKYQEILARYPWLLGCQHILVERHTTLDDRNIPDFTGVRARDGTRDVFEIKQPFLNCFRRDGEFSAGFHLAWDQAERYLTFVRKNCDYLRSEKNLLFSNAHCFLLVGWQLSSEQARRFHEKEAHNPSISLLSYEQVLKQAGALLELVKLASGDVGLPGATGGAV